MKSICIAAIVALCAGSAVAEQIAQTGFEEAAALSTGTKYSLRGAGPAGRYLSNGAGNLTVDYAGSASELGFKSWFVGDGSGRDSYGDYIGAVDYYNHQGSGSWEGEQLGYRDAGLCSITLELETVDVSDYEDVTVSFYLKRLYNVSDIDEGVRVWVEDELGTEYEVINAFGPTDFGALTAQYAWTPFSVAIPDSANELSFYLELASDGYNEGVGLDTISFDGTYVPEPASLVLLALGALALRRR